MITVNAMGDACPIPVVKTKKAAQQMKEGGILETLVDNEIAVQNLTKMAEQMNWKVRSERKGEAAFRVEMEIPAAENKEAEGSTAAEKNSADDACACIPDSRGDLVVVISNHFMGGGSEELGKSLLKGFIYAVSQQDTLPKTILFYNGGAALTCEGSEALEDLKSMEAQGVEILTCGTCLNFYGLTEKLRVGGVTNMYVIVEKMTSAGKVVKPC